jgi:hypothetical protein
MPAGWILFVLLRCATLSGWRRAHDALAKPAHRIAGWGLVALALAAAGTVAALGLLFRLALKSRLKTRFRRR